MKRYQFAIDDDTWNEWKRTLPRDKSLEQRIIELIEADTRGIVDYPDGEPTATETTYGNALADDFFESTPANPCRAALEGWTPGTPGDDRDRRQESARQLLEWLRDRDGAQKGDVRSEIGDELLLPSHNSFDSWWETVGQSALNHAEEQGYVKLSGRTWYWVGENE